MFARQFVLAAVLCICALLSTSSWLSPVSATAANGLVGSSTSLNIAVMVHCYNTTLDQSATIGPHIIKSADVIYCGQGLGAYDDWFRTHLTFSRVVNGQGGIPSGTGVNVPLNLVFFNIGGINYLQTDQNAIANEYKNAVQNALILTQQLGAFGGYNAATDKWDAPCYMCPPSLNYTKYPYLAPGIYGMRFPIILTPGFSDNIPIMSGTPAVLTNTVFTACQLSKECIVIGQYVGSDAWLKCKPQQLYVDNPADPTNPLLVTMTPPECLKAVDPSLPADKRLGARRYDYGFSALPSQSGMLAQLTALFKTKGASTAVVFISGQADYLRQILTPALAGLKANKIDLVMDYVTLNVDGTPFTDTQVQQYGDAVIAGNPELFIYIASALVQGDSTTAFKFLDYFRQKQWTPKAVVLPGGTTFALGMEMNYQGANAKVGDGGYYYGCNFNDFRLRSPAFNALNGTVADPNWEPFPSTTELYSSQVLMNEYMKDWGDTTPTSMMQGYNLPMILAQTLLIATRLFYAAGTDDARLMQQASLSLSVPSAAGLLQFDGYGRITSTDQYVLQYGQSGGDFHLITPLDVGEPDIYPMPTWKERVAPTEGSASFLGTSNEKVVVAITTVVNVYLLVLMIFVILNRRNAIIKSSSPIFCVLCLLGGMVAVSSNYTQSLYAVSAGCGAGAWLLTIGFTIMFASLEVKTYRIFRIFDSGKLQVVKITNNDLYMIISALISIDIILNIIWSGATGFPVQYIQVDAYRPVYDYVQCGYNSTSTGIIYAHLAYKSFLVVSGIILTILARNTPSSFNETPYLAASLYNCSILLLFLLPLVATGAGGRETTYLIRSYGILLVVLSTCSILFVPKMIMLWVDDGDSLQTATGATATVKVSALQTGEGGGSRQTNASGPGNKYAPIRSPTAGKSTVGATHVALSVHQRSPTAESGALMAQQTTAASASHDSSNDIAAGAAATAEIAQLRQIVADLRARLEMAGVESPLPGQPSQADSV